MGLNEIFQFYRRREIWVLLFYKWSDEESKKLKDEYRALAEKMYGVIKVGAIDCQEDEELCEEFAVYQVPTIKVFQESYSDDGERYTGKSEWKSIANFATQKMQSFVSLVNKDNYQQFIEREPTKYKVLLFTERKTTAPIFKALSK
jgi:thioredoxin-like negative regulator of GroEL